MLGIFLFTLYVAWVITTIPIDGGVHTFSETNEKIFGGNIEAGSYVSQKRLKSFFVFLEAENYSSWEKNALLQNSIEIENGRVFFKNTYSLPAVLNNDCSDIYCFQNRVSFQSLPSIFWKGLIGVEDLRFISHPGIDLKSIMRALLTDLKKMKLEQGGSTLTQQLIKNLYLTNEKKFIRKFKEIILSIYFENKYSKEEILELYFNEIEWGALQGIKIKGIHAASLMYFNKKLEKADPYEVAIIISMLKGPYYYNPLRYPERLRKRSDVVFRKLQQLNLFSSKDYQWKDIDWEKWKKQLEELNNDFSYRTFWRTGREDSALDFFEKYSLIYSSKKVLAGIHKKIGNKDVAIKLITGEINSDKKISYYSKYERSKERAIENEFHQIGSTIKPILYNIYRQMGVKPFDEVETTPLTFKLKSGVWQPREAIRELPDKVTVDLALLKSLNRPNLRLAQSLGFEEIEKVLEVKIPRLKKPLAEFPAQLLGSIELSLNELYLIYQEFFKENCLEAEEVNWILNELSDPKKTTIRNVVAKELVTQKFFGKTGTSNNGYDNWFLAFDGNQLTLVWLGYEGKKDTNDLKLYGSNSAYLVYQDFLLNRGRRLVDMACQYDNLEL